MMVALGPGWSGSIFHLHSAFGTASSTLIEVKLAYSVGNLLTQHLK